MQVQRDGYLEKPQMRLTLQEPNVLRQTLLDIPGISAISIRGQGFALVSSADRTYGVQVVGVNPQEEPAVSSIPGTIHTGSYLATQGSLDVVLGETLARNLKVSIRDEITLLGQGKDGSLAASVLSVRGIFRSGSSEVDHSMIQIDISTFQDIFSMPGEAHTLVLKTENLRDSEHLQDEIRKVIHGLPQSLRVLRWDQLLPGLKQAIELDLASSWLFYFSLIVIVCFSILNTFLMSILERTHEFGIILALGATPKRIGRMVYLESLLLTLLGVGGGILLGGALTLYFGAYGFSIPGTEEIMKLWNLPLVIYPRLTFKVLCVGPGIVGFAALISVLYPIIRVIRLEAIDAMGKT